MAFTFRSNSESFLQNLQNENQFKDFTLAGRSCFIGVHKNVLSTRSLFFKKLFQGSQNLQPFMQFEEVGLDVLQAVVSFLYVGYVEVLAPIAEDFLKLAKQLEIQELTGSVDRVDTENSSLDDDNFAETLAAVTESPPVSDTLEKVDETTEEIKYEIDNIVSDTVAENPGPSTIIDPVMLDNTENFCEGVDEEGTNEPSKISDTQVISEEQFSILTKRLFTCDLCEFETFSQKRFYLHKRKIHQDEKYFCDQCGDSFFQKDGLKNHRERKHEMIRYPCNQCDYKALSSETLRGHVKNIHERIPIYCDECGHLAETMNILKHHKEAVHGNVVHSCNICEYTTKIKAYLQGHINTKHSSKRYFCKICGHKSKTLSNVYRHKRSTHDGIRYACDVEGCDYKGTEKSSLECHKRSLHAGIKYYCDAQNCVAVYTQKTNLKKHKDQKHAESPREIIECSKCKLKFAARRSLKRHLGRAKCLKGQPMNTEV